LLNRVQPILSSTCDVLYILILKIDGPMATLRIEVYIVVVIMEAVFQLIGDIPLFINISYY